MDLLLLTYHTNEFGYIMAYEENVFAIYFNYTTLSQIQQKLKRIY